MNSSLQDIQVDIQRLATQQHQLKTNDILLSEQQKQHALNSQRQQFQAMNQQMYQMQQPYYNNVSGYMSIGHVSQGIQFSHLPPGAKQPADQSQFYLHEQPVVRRTWDLPADTTGPSYHLPEVIKTNKPQHNQGFMLHEPNEIQHELRYQNGDHHGAHNKSGFTLSQQHALQNQSTTYSEPNTPNRASPQHRNTSVHRQISQLMGDGDNNKMSFATLAQYNDSEKAKNSVIHAPIPTPPVDDMEPQNISFIGNSDDNYVQGISKLNISSGTRTYRIPSPTRPHISRNSFQQVPPSENVAVLPDADNSSNEKGFYISFDNEQPKKPKPPLRLKRGSPKKEKVSLPSNNIENNVSSHHRVDSQENIVRERHKPLEVEVKRDELANTENQNIAKLEVKKVKTEQIKKEKDIGTALVIGNELKHLDPVSTIYVYIRFVDDLLKRPQSFVN